ncbi:helix-turn-helix transcriptional regulator [Oceanobacillus kimchii]|uniref:helix-turn-helix transcriptional regulator n=1 Tax=Oceanobacillus kimchii TaxID=746691 RepID=UPI003B0235A9
MKNLALQESRKSKFLTQQELAIKLKEKGMKSVSKQSISNWENGYSTPRLDGAIYLSQVLEKDVGFLFGQHVQETHTNKQEVS